MVVISFGYGEYIMPPKDALAVMEILQKSEKYESKYVSGGENTHHVYPNTEALIARLISDDLYRMAKLAGKPEK